MFMFDTFTSHSLLLLCSIMKDNRIHREAAKANENSVDDDEPDTSYEMKEE